MTTIKKHYDQIDALKGIAIFLVILGHAIILYPVNLHENKICLAIFDFISDVHMPLFFIIAGYNFHYYGNYKEYIIKKAKRLLLPYFIFNLLEIIPRLLLSGFINKQISINDFIVNMFLYGGNYWFVYVLFVICLIFPILSKLKGNIAYIGLVILSFVISIFNPGYSLFALNLVFRYLCYFVIGYVLSKKINLFENANISNIKRLCLFVISFVLWIIIFINSENINSVVYSFLVAFVGFISLYLFGFKTIINLFKEIGKYSLPLFLMNGFALVASRTIICAITSNPLIIICFNVIFDIFVPYLAIRYLFINNKYLKAIIGQ